MNKILVVAMVASLATIAVSSPAQSQSRPAEQSDAQQSDGERWFNLMSKALNELNFEASFVHVQADRIEPYQWVHGVSEEGRQYEWIMQMNGPGFRALRIDDVVSHFHPAANSYSLRSQSVSNLIPNAFSKPFAEIEDFYRAVAVGGARVLNRNAQHIRLVSRDNQRYGFSVWVDRENGMPLKVLMVNQDGEIMEQLQLTNLTTRQLGNEFLQQLDDVEQPPMLAELRQTKAPELSLRPHWAPMGFELLKAERRKLVVEDTWVDHYLYSDGLAEFSVYLADASASSNGRSLSVRGPHTLFSQAVGEVTVTVVGQVPLEVAKQVASSVQ